MAQYMENKIHVLIATTVIEVGVNNPNATVMVITGAERFGLASLHQLRGRVGRGSIKSYCILQTSPGVEATQNLEILCSETNGLEIAKADLLNRGTGNLLGEEQSGRNDYIELMLKYPNLDKKIKEILENVASGDMIKKFIDTYEEWYMYDRAE